MGGSWHPDGNRCPPAKTPVTSPGRDLPCSGIRPSGVTDLPHRPASARPGCGSCNPLSSLPASPHLPACQCASPDRLPEHTSTGRQCPPHLLACHVAAGSFLYPGSVCPAPRQDLSGTRPAPQPEGQAPILKTDRRCRKMPGTAELSGNPAQICCRRPFPAYDM